MSTPPIVVDAVEPFKRLYDFTKKHLLVINAVILFSGSVVAALDFLLPILKPLLVWVYVATGVLAALMFLVAAFPVLWARINLELGRAPVAASGVVPIHKRAAWQGATVLLIGITAAGITSLAKAGKGGVIADTFPAAKDMQVSLLSLNAKSDRIQTGVDSANDKLDSIAKALDPENAADRCPDLQCALTEGAGRATLEKLWSKGGRLPPAPVLQADLMNRVMHGKRANRLQTIDFLLDHGFPADIKISPRVIDQSELPAKGIPVMSQAWQVAGLARSTTTRFTRAVQGSQELLEWDDVASCIVRTSGGMTAIQLAALAGDDVLFAHLRQRGVKVPAEPVVCRWKSGMDIPRPGHPGQFMGRATIGEAAIGFDDKGNATVLASTR